MQSSLFTTSITSAKPMAVQKNNVTQRPVTSRAIAGIKAVAGPSSYSMMSSSIGKMHTPITIKYQNVLQMSASQNSFFGPAPNAFKTMGARQVATQASNNKYSAGVSKTTTPSMLLGSSQKSQNFRVGNVPSISIYGGMPTQRTSV
jgi:hypothetical protein